MVASSRSRVDLMGIEVDNVSAQDVVDCLIGTLGRGQGGWIATPNVDILRQAVANPELAEMVEQADLIIPDGMPLVWASRLQRTPLQARVPTSELVYPLARAAALAGYSFFLLGGPPGVAESAVPALKQEAHQLLVAGCYAPPYGFENDPEAMTRIVKALDDANPDIVICGFGFPKQERLAVALRPHFPSTWFISAGGTFSMLAGETPAAPRWMRRSGLEWLHRLRLEPVRLFRRYVINDLPFAVRLLATSLVRRFRTMKPHN
jgi:N-acetylglucosaminyldiphosphoundecaprenol N-acetyl-beta-D-mannosaminyltransferase